MGIFAGYVMRPGCRWAGRYLVWSLDEFVGMDLTAAASGRSDEAMKLRYPQETARIDTGDLGLVFPLRPVYDWWNSTLEYTWNLIVHSKAGRGASTAPEYRPVFYAATI